VHIVHSAARNETDKQCDSPLDLGSSLCAFNRFSVQKRVQKIK
jgi:hypothetical protein